MGSTTTDRRIGLNSGAAFKVPCKAASTANLVLSGEQTVDGVACVTGDRVLVKNQTDQTTNGIWVVSTASWTRDLDFDGNLDAVTGTLVMTLNGSANSNSFWRLATTGAINFGSSLISFARSFVNDSTLISFIQAGIGAIARSLQDKARESVSVLDFYANGVSGVAVDPTGVVDSTLGIQAAIQSLAAWSPNDATNLSGYYQYANPSRTLLFPAGTYKITAPLLVRGNTIKIKGEGPYNSVIKYVGAAIINEIIRFQGSISCELSDIGLDGGLPYLPAGTETYGALAGLCLDTAPYFTSYNLQIQRHRVDGIRAGHMWESFFSNTIIRDGGYFATAGGGATPGACIHTTTNLMNCVFFPGGEADNTIFLKPTLTGPGHLFRSDVPGQNLTFISPIHEGGTYTVNYASLNDSKFYINNQTNFQMSGGYFYTHAQNFGAFSAAIFNITEQNPGVTIRDVQIYVYSGGGYTVQQVTHIADISNAYPTIMDNISIFDSTGSLSYAYYIQGSTNSPYVVGNQNYTCPTTQPASFLFQAASATYFQGTITCINSVAGTNTQTVFGGGIAAGVVITPANGGIAPPRVGTFTPVANGLTNVGGAPTLVGKYTRVGDRVFYTIKITPVTNTSCVANTTYFTGLPYTQADQDVCFSSSQLISQGAGVGVMAGGQVSPASWTNATYPVAISGSYRTTDTY